jgi:hypothetical protein
MAKIESKEEWDPSRCRYRLELCKKEFQAVNTRIENVEGNVGQSLSNHRDEVNRLLDTHQEAISKEIKAGINNVKNKVVIAQKSLGDKIDKLDEFDNTLKGNGEKGINEKARWLKWEVRLIFGWLLLITILILGGKTQGGLTLENIKNALFGTPKVEVVDPPPPPIETPIILVPIDNKYELIIDPNHFIHVEEVNSVE